MRIGIDSRLPTYRRGGISQYVLQLLPAIAELDGQNEYILFHSRKERRTFGPGAGNFQRLDLWTPCHHRLEKWSLAAELLPRQLDVLHSPDFIPPAAGARRRLITVHDLNFIYYPQFLTADSRRYYLDQIRWAVSAADHIAADSEATRQDIVELLGVAPAKVTTIHLAASPIYAREYAAEAIEKTLGRLNLPRDFILFVGTLEPRKNIPTLLRAYQALRQAEGVDVPLVLAGARGWQEQEIFMLIDELDLGPFVRHLPDVIDEALAMLYRAAALLALPSHYEGFGLPVLEAMHSGCPVVVSNRGSLAEVAGEAALVLPPDDADAWAQALGQVLNDETLRQELIARGHEQASRFTWRSTAAATLRLYQQLGEM